tara:strand:- start:26529 stop:27083 length:555 start_codon:yes stop_codon:yes gene_type:complete
MSEYKQGDKITAKISTRDSDGNEVIREVTGIVQDVDQWGDYWIDPSDVTGLVVNGEGHLGILAEEIVGLADNHVARNIQRTGGTPQQPSQTPVSEAQQGEPVTPNRSNDKEIEELLRFLQEMEDSEDGEQVETEHPSTPTEDGDKQTPESKSGACAPSQTGNKINWIKLILLTIGLADIIIHLI